MANKAKGEMAKIARIQSSPVNGLPPDARQAQQ